MPYDATGSKQKQCMTIRNLNNIAVESQLHTKHHRALPCSTLGFYQARDLCQAVLNRLGVVVGRSWGSFGPSWGHVGSVLGRLGAVVGHLGTVSGCLESSWDRLFGRLEAVLGCLGVV